jgi:hypothetical protein
MSCRTPNNIDGIIGLKHAQKVSLKAFSEKNSLLTGLKEESVYAFPIESLLSSQILDSSHIHPFVLNALEDFA